MVMVMVMVMVGGDGDDDDDDGDGDDDDDDDGDDDDDDDDQTYLKNGTEHMNQPSSRVFRDEFSHQLHQGEANQGGRHQVKVSPYKAIHLRNSHEIRMNNLRKLDHNIKQLDLNHLYDN